MTINQPAAQFSPLAEGRRRGRDLTGLRFGRLVVASLAAKDSASRRRWNCECACGQRKILQTHDLTTGRVVSCGCHSRDMARTRQRKHDMSKTRLHHVWLGMKQRCSNPNHKSYKNYGGRGITVCERWMQSFSHFLADMGERPAPNLTLERMDNDGNYEPSNCRWATRKEQRMNSRKPKMDVAQ